MSNDYLEGEKSQCPECAKKGRDNSQDNLHNYGEGLGSHCFSCGHTRPQIAGSVLLCCITSAAPTILPSSNCLINPGILMFTGQPCTQVGFLQSKQR